MTKEIPEEAVSFLNHLKTYRENPEQGHAWNPYGKEVTALLLTSTGRTTGKPRTRPLIYRKIGGNYVIVASKGGAPDNPMWYRNLLSNPDCEIQVIRDHIKCRARTAVGAERAELWPQMVDLLPQYAEYQSKTDREIPVIVLEPV